MASDYKSLTFESTAVKHLSFSVSCVRLLISKLNIKTGKEGKVRECRVEATCLLFYLRLSITTVHKIISFY